MNYDDFLLRGQEMYEESKTATKWFVILADGDTLISSGLDEFEIYAEFKKLNFDFEQFCSFGWVYDGDWKDLFNSVEIIERYDRS